MCALLYVAATVAYQVPQVYKVASHDVRSHKPLSSVSLLPIGAHTLPVIKHVLATGRKCRQLNDCCTSPAKSGSAVISGPRCARCVALTELYIQDSPASPTARESETVVWAGGEDEKRLGVSTRGIYLLFNGVCKRLRRLQLVSCELLGYDAIQHMINAVRLLDWCQRRNAAHAVPSLPSRLPQ